MYRLPFDMRRLRPWVANSNSTPWDFRNEGRWKPDEDRAADRPSRSYRAEAYRAGGKLRARRGLSSFACGMFWKKSWRGFLKSSASTSSATCSTLRKAVLHSKSFLLKLKQSSRLRKLSAVEPIWLMRYAGVRRKPELVRDCSAQPRGWTLLRRGRSQPSDAILDGADDPRLSARNGSGNGDQWRGELHRDIQHPTFRTG